jgi:hypothetical protein
MFTAIKSLASEAFLVALRLSHHGRGWGCHILGRLLSRNPGIDSLSLRIGRPQLSPFYCFQTAPLSCTPGACAHRGISCNPSCFLNCNFGMFFCCFIFRIGYSQLFPSYCFQTEPFSGVWVNLMGGAILELPIRILLRLLPRCSRETCKSICWSIDHGIAL